MQQALNQLSYKDKSEGILDFVKYLLGKVLLNFILMPILPSNRHD